MFCSGLVLEKPVLQVFEFASGILMHADTYTYKRACVSVVICGPVSSVEHHFLSLDKLS